MAGWDKMIRQFDMIPNSARFYLLSTGLPFKDAGYTADGHTYNTPIREPDVFSSSLRDLESETVKEGKKDMRIWCGQFHCIAHGLRMYLEARWIVIRHLLDHYSWEWIMDNLPKADSLFTEHGNEPGMYRYKDALIPISKYDFYPGNFEQWVSFLERIYATQFTEDDRTRLGPLAFCVTVYSHADGHSVTEHFLYKDTMKQF